jgi:hypothetical protein
MGKVVAAVVALFILTFQAVSADGADSGNPMIRSCVAWYRDIHNLKSLTDPALAPELTYSSHVTGGRQAQKTIIFADSKIDASGREKIAEGIRSTNRFLRDRFAIPARLNIDAPWASPSPYSVGFGRMCELSFPQRYICEGHMLSELQSASIGEHEYGHAIFKSHMAYLAGTGKVSKRYLDFTRVYAENRKLMLLALEQKNLSLRLEGAENEFIRRGLNSRLTEIQKQIDSQTLKANKARARLGGASGGFYVEYEELFSDLLPIAKRNDPKAVAVALGGADAKVRDASQVKSAAGWLAESSGTSEVKTHVFAPTMAHVWSRYLNQASTEEERVVMLQRVFFAIARECDRRLDDTSLWALSAEERNRRLIESIDGVMRAQ